MSYCGYVVEVKELRKHSNADKLQIATFFGNDTVVDLTTHLGDRGIYFPSDGQLSEEYCKHNDLTERYENGKNVGGYLDPNKRNIKPIRLRGEKSDGLFMPLSSLDYLKHNLKVGDRVDIISGHEVCCKYIPKTNKKNGPRNLGNKTRKKKVPISPLFNEHADTEQLAFNLGVFKEGDIVEITLKMHGTSQRTAYLPVLKGYKRSLLNKILGREGTPIYEWDYISGTRRTVIGEYEGGEKFREQHAKFFEGKLHKGEEVFYEIVGYVDENTPIMNKGSNKKLGKEFVDQYGDETVFSYGCKPGESKAYVYRMTMTNEDGDVVEYPPDFMRYRCEQMGANYVPVFTVFNIAIDDELDGTIDDLKPGEFVKHIAEFFYDGPDPIGKTHVREGVVCRIINRPRFCAYKHKNFSFKVLEGIIVDSISNDLNCNYSNDILSEL